MININKLKKIKSEFPVLVGKNIISAKDCKKLIAEIVNAKSFDDLISGMYGIQEPSPEKRIKMNPEIIDLVIVPGIAFDRQGGRLGHGKGYYDRFLQFTRAFRLGLAFDCQLLKTVPTESHDVPMNAILSESGIVETNT